MSAGLIRHLHTRDTSLAYVSRAPLAEIEKHKARKGWDFPWYSLYGSDFNYDFHVTLDDSVTPIEYNYRNKAEHEQAGTSYYIASEQPIEGPGGQRPRHDPRLLGVTWPMSTGGLSKTRLGRLHDVMAGHVERGAAPRLVTLVSRRGEVHVDAIGTTSVDGSDPIRRDTIIRISSMTMPIVAAATMIRRVFGR